MKQSMQGPRKKQSRLRAAAAAAAAGCGDDLVGVRPASLMRGRLRRHQLQQRGFFWLARFRGSFERRVLFQDLAHAKKGSDKYRILTGALDSKTRIRLAFRINGTALKSYISSVRTLKGPFLQ